MTIRFRQVLTLIFAIVFSIALVGCGSSSNSNDTTDTGAPVAKRDTPLGEIYTDSDGMTLYTFNNDAPNQSNCNAGCAVAWPPFMAAESATDDGRFTIITRDDGSKQWALDGWPLYYWMNDNVPGDTTGEEVNSLWYVAHTVPVSKWSADVTTGGVTNTETVLTDSDRMTLYIFTPDKDVTNGSACNGGCATTWPPLMATDSNVASGDFSIVTRDDGSKQWAYLGMPLYGWASDTAPGDTTGEEVNDVWYVAHPLPVSKFNTTAQGVVLTDNEWITLYVLENETSGSLACTGGCLTSWPPLLVDTGDIDRGNYTIFTNSNGDSQWAYKDQPLYYYIGDSAPDDTTGQGLTGPNSDTWIVATP